MTTAYTMTGHDASGVHVATADRTLDAALGYALTDAAGALVGRVATRPELDVLARRERVVAWTLTRSAGPLPTLVDLPVDYRRNPLVPEDFDGAAAAELRRRVAAGAEGPELRALSIEYGLPINFIIGLFVRDEDAGR